MTILSKDDKIAVVYDDHQLFAEMLSSWLIKAGIFTYVYSFTQKEKLMQFFFLNDHKGIFLFSDYYIGDTNSMSTIYDIRQLCPTLKLIFITSCINPVLLRKFLEMNPVGLLSKTPGLEEVFTCTRQIEHRKRFVSPYLQAIIDTEDNTGADQHFTTREIELLGLFAKGFSVATTAKTLYLSKHTIISHRRNMMRKAKCSTIVELLAYARNIGIIT